MSHKTILAQCRGPEMYCNKCDLVLPETWVLGPSCGGWGSISACGRPAVGNILLLMVSSTPRTPCPGPRTAGGGLEGSQDGGSTARAEGPV